MDATETVTVLFTDLVESTALASRVGPGSAEALRREHFALLREAIAETGGREVKNLGDGLMAVFASASRGVDCAVAMQQRLEARNRRAEEPLAVRIGLSLGDADREGDDYFGPPVVEAARLCAAAAGGQILTVELVRAMAAARSAHEFRATGERELKGLPAPVATYEIAWSPAAIEAPVPLPARLRDEQPGAFAGRAGEERALASLWEQARDGSRRVALLSGEPGIGKTRLAGRQALAAHAQGAVVLFGRCDAELTVPYRPWIEAVRHYVEHAPAEVLEAHVARHGGRVARLAPALAQRAAGADAPDAGDPDTERYLLFGAVADLLRHAAVAAGEPVVLVLDDLHWADRPTLSLLRHVVAAPADAGLLVIGTFRDTEPDADPELARMLADLRREPGVERIALEGLETDDVAELMTGLTGRDLDERGTALAGEIARETHGNAFFVGELLRAVADAGEVGSVDELGLPDSVVEVVGRRVDALGVELADVLTAAAAIGRDVDADLLARVVGVDDHELLGRLDTATAAALLRESSETPGRFTFVHGLINHTLVTRIGPSRRARLHRRIAQALDELCAGRPDERAAERAHHWALTGVAADRPRAVDACLRAGRGALHDLAPAEALRWFRRGLDLLDGGRAVCDDGALRCDLLTGAGEAQRHAGDLDFRETLLHACALADRLGDADRLARAALANSRGHPSTMGFVDDERVAALRRALELDGGSQPARRARLLALLAMELVWDGDPDGRRALADEALALAREHGDERTLALVLRDHYHARWSPDTVQERTAWAQELGALADRLDEPLLQSQAALLALFAAVDRGDMAAAERHRDRCMALAERVGQPGMLWHAHYAAGLVALLAGDLDAAVRFADRALELGRDAEPDALMVYGGQSALISAERGRQEEVVALTEQIVESNPGLPLFSAGLVDLYLHVGRVEDAQLLLDELREAGFENLPRDQAWTTAYAWLCRAAAGLADRAAAADLYPLGLPLLGLACSNGAAAHDSIDHCLGMLATALGDHDRAERHFAEAERFEEAAGMRASLALTRLWRARCLLDRGRDADRRRARVLLAASMDASREHGYVRFLAWAQQLADEHDLAAA
ncbi:MAG TPA: AAA family ATPase [Capillimicrobium sp.]|nr:AAA family ATPase [Capillimicrobium sp.]